ncbi:MAG: sulfur carrier protein ThiS [Phycisphaeraceae bacterium]
MKLKLNGETRETSARTVRQLVEELGLGRQAVAVEVNREIVPRKQHESTELRDGDEVEVVSLVGGG